MSATRFGIKRYVKKSMIGICVGLLLIASAVPSFAMSVDAGETPYYDSSPLIAAGGLDNSVHNPATDGTFVAWKFGAGSPSTTCNSLYATAFSDLSPTLVQTILKNSSWAISEGKLVWTNQVVECRPYQPESNPGIYGVDLFTGEDFVVTTEPTSWNERTGSHSLGFEGRMVMWFTSDPAAPESSVLRARNIDDNEQPYTIATVPPGSEAAFPRLYDQNFYWLERPLDGSPNRVVRASIGGEPETILIEDEIAWFDVRADVIVWRTAGSLRVRELASKAVLNIAEISPYHDGQPVTDGRYVVWVTSDLSGVPVFRIQAYDLATGSLFTLKEYEAGPGTVINMGNVDFQNGLIVWDYMESGPISGGSEIRAAWIADVRPTARRPPGLEDVKQTYYSETGHYLGWGFRDYWTANGGLPVFGYPMTEEFTERSIDTGQDYTVQFTERQRFEWHPDNVGTPYEVLLGRLGSEILSLQGRDWTMFPKANSASSHYFVETGHAIAPEFWAYWSTHGLEFGDPGVTFRESLALFGYPLSPSMMETNADGHTVLTQYFERAVFEYHPANADPYRVLLRRLGVEVLTEREWFVRGAN
jgi:hypothetical protein